MRGPTYAVRKGQTPMLQPKEARKLLDRIDTGTSIGLRDRALIALMVYSFARVGAALAMRVEDIFTERGGCGSACAKKAARPTPCPATIISKTT